jgi:hypothetical protein
MRTALYKCRVCGKINKLSVSEFVTSFPKKYSYMTMGCLKSSLDYNKNIMMACDSDHYGVMDFVGITKEDKDTLC